MAKRDGIFPTFFLSGFECSSFLWKDAGRRNLSAELGHDIAPRDMQAATPAGWNGRMIIRRGGAWYDRR